MKRNKLKISKAQSAYGAVVYWVTFSAALICIAGPLIAMLAPEKNVLNPHLVFSGIWEGKTADEVWACAGEGFPGGHFYRGRFFSGDGFTQFGIVLGSSAALWGLLAAAGFLKEKSYGYAGACIFVSAVIVFAMAGVVNLN